MLTLDALRIVVESEIGKADWFGEAGWDSLAHVTLLCLLEEKYGLEITEERIGRLTSLQAILEELNKGVKS